jgi:DNA-binding MarR family transcriptional regulator
VATRKRNSLVLRDFVPYRLSVLSNLVSSGIASVYARRFSLTIPEWRVIAVLGNQGRLSASDVARHTAMDKVAVSRAVARLLHAGRIRKIASRADRRRSSLTLAPAGLAVYRRIAPLALGIEAQLLAALSASERRAFMAILDRLHARATSLLQELQPQ